MSESPPDEFKMTELGPLPKGWDVVRLEAVLDCWRKKYVESEVQI